MNKTIDISLAGILFHLDESAYYKLKKYLRSVKASLKDTGDASEVMAEIEARIAELFLEKQAHPQQVINEQNIDDIIMVMGQPEDYEEEVEPGTKKTYQAVKKSLFRDMDNNVLGGVAAGLAHYLGLDITIIRLLLVVLLFVTHGSIVLIYLLLWIVVPRAKTASDKLRMKGEKVDVDSIVDQVATEEDTGKKKIKLGEKVEDTSKELGSVFLKILGFLLILITGIILTSLIVAIVSLLPFVSTGFGVPDLPFDDFIGISAGWIGVLSIILVGIPFLLLFLLGVKMLFPNTKPINSNVFIVAGTIWFLSLIFIIGKSSMIAAQKNSKVTLFNSEGILPVTKDTLYIDEQDLIKNIPNYYSATHVNFSFYPSKDKNYHYKIYKFAEGITPKEAKKNAKKIVFKFTGDSLTNTYIFSKFIKYPNQNLTATRKVNVKIYIPENGIVHLSEYVSNDTKNLWADYPKVITNQNGKIELISEYTDIDEKELDDEIIIGNKNMQLKIDEEGIEIYGDSKDKKKTHIIINDDGINIKTQAKQGDSSSITIDKKGIKTK